MHDMEKFWEILKAISPNTSVQDLGIHLSEFLKDIDESEGPDHLSEQSRDQE